MGTVFGTIYYICNIKTPMKIKRIKHWIRKNIIRWILNSIKLSLVAYLSFYLLKLTADIELIKEIWSMNERYYLATYVTIQVVVTFILYEGFGKLFEMYIYYWIGKNKEEYLIDLDKDEEKVIKKFIHMIVEVLKFFKITDLDDLSLFDDIALDKNKFREKWQKNVQIINSIAGVFILSLANLFAFNDSTILFIWLSISLVILVFLSFTFLIIYYILIENFHLINLGMKSISVSGRHNRRNKIE